jgi:hypothetical protein
VDLVFDIRTGKLFMLLRVTVAFPIFPVLLLGSTGVLHSSADKFAEGPEEFADCRLFNCNSFGVPRAFGVVIFINNKKAEHQFRLNRTRSYYYFYIISPKLERKSYLRK